MLYKNESAPQKIIEKRIVECEAERVKIKVGEIEIDVKGGILNKNDVISIGGYDPDWIQEMTIKLSIWEAPKIMLSGIVKHIPKG